jgi:hypothetical protein
MRTPCAAAIGTAAGTSVGSSPTRFRLSAPVDQHADAEAGGRPKPCETADLVERIDVHDEAMAEDERKVLGRRQVRAGVQDPAGRDAGGERRVCVSGRVRVDAGARVAKRPHDPWILVTDDRVVAVERAVRECGDELAKAQRDVGEVVDVERASEARDEFARLLPFRTCGVCSRHSGRLPSRG